MSRIIASVIAAAIMLLSFGSIAFAEELKWEEANRPNMLFGNEWPLRPADGYINQQNPPDFSWPRIAGARYDIKICSDKELTNVKYEKTNLENNFYNFPHPFETGTYYWSVRFITSEGTSEWMPAMRFLILPTAGVYTVETLEGIIESIPEGHPRCAPTPAALAEYRKIKDVNAKAKHYYESVKRTVQGFMEAPIPEEPVYDPANSTALRGTTSAVQNRMAKAGELYVYDGDMDAARYCIDVMLSVCEWDIHGATAYEHQDQAFREIMLGMASGFDYVYNVMTPAERKVIAENLEERMKILEHPTKGLTDAPYRLTDLPYASHGWTATGFLLQAAVATLGDVPFAEEILKKYVPIFTNLAPVWAREDGGYCQGTGYGAGSVAVNEAVVFDLDRFGIANLSNKAYYKNAYKYSLYFTGGTYGSAFGDQSRGNFDSNWTTTNMFLTHMVGNGYAKWQNDFYKYGTLGVPQNYYLQVYPEAEAKAPVDLPKSMALPDIGHVAMHSDLTDPYGRISLYFKSSPFGAYNHSHADQNSFTVVAYDQELAADTGHYDGYAYDFYNNYYQRSHAHNTITYGNGKYEQAGGYMKANGYISNFITHPDFDLATGSAASAYDYRYDPKTGSYTEKSDMPLDKFERSIIYVRPDQYLVIDDLKIRDEKKAPFEWWLQAKENIEMYTTEDGARITSGTAALDTKIHYPSVSGSYSDIFSGTDLVPHTPSGTHAKSPVHKRIWFRTPETSETKIVATMSVHKTDEPSQYVYTKKHDGWMKLTFEDGTRAYVNLTSGTVEMEEFKTDATAIVVKKETVMGVNATKVERNGEVIFESEKTSSYIYGKNELSLSSAEDTKVKIKTAEITSVKNEKGDIIAPGKMEFGYNWNYSDGFFNADMYKGFFTLYVNEKPLPGSPADGNNLKYIIDGKQYEADATGYYDHDNNKILTAVLENKTDFYFLDKAEDISIRGGAKPGELLLLREGEQVKITGDNPSIVLRALAGAEILKGEKIPVDEAKKLCTVFVEVEDYTKKDTDGRIYDTRAFLSGGAGVTEFNNFGDSMTWEVEIPEDGEYDLVLCYVGWSGNQGLLERMYNINGNAASFNMPETGNYGQVASEWITSRIPASVKLEKGINEITLYPKSGNWNFDWFGLIKK